MHILYMPVYIFKYIYIREVINLINYRLSIKNVFDSIKLVTIN